MENTTLVCSAQGWCGPNVSTFSSEWDDNVNSFLMAPDVIKPPPQFQDPEEPSQASPTNSAAVIRQDKDCLSSMKKERRSRPTSNIELHRRSLSLSTTVNSNPGVARRRCESYALSYPSSSSEDSGSGSGSDSTSARRGDRLPDAVPGSRSRSIVLKKAKRKPAPPVRTVSLQRLAAEKYSERKLQGLHLKKDAQSIMILPDLIPTSKQEVAKCKKPTPTAEAPGKVALKTSASSHRALNELRSSEPCKSGLGPSVATPINEGNSEINTSPSSSHSSPSQPSISSPSKRFGSNSPSSGYASQCETPTQSVLSSVTAGPSQLGCRMRHKPSSVIPGQRARNRNARLSLQLPELQQTPDPEPVQPKANRRYSDSTEATRPKQRMSNSLLIMPVVTQEDLNNVHLRSVSSSDLENAQETTTDVIEEETERGGSSLSPTNHQKAKPPVAPKPQRSKWPPNAMVQPSFGTASDPEPPTVAASERPGDIYAMINKAKPTVTVPSQSTGRAHHQRQQKDCFFLEGHYPQPMRESRQPQPPCTFEPQNPNVLPFNTTTCSNQYELHMKRRAPPPPLTKTPAVDNSLYYDSAAQKSSDDAQSPNKLCKSPKSPNSASQYHVTLYGVIPSYPMVIEQQHSNAPDHPTYDVEKRDQIPDLGPLQLVGEEDDVFLYKSKSQTTEDLFTIIHRSKRKLLGRKDSFENKQGDPDTQTLGSGASKISSQNDNFMAFLRRTRSAKASCNERISATELLRSSKPTATIAANMTHCKNSYEQSHGP